MDDGVGDALMGFDVIETAQRALQIFQPLAEAPAALVDKRLAGEIFPVARLLADQHERRAGRAFAGNHLRRVSIKLAAPAVRLLAAQHRQRRDRRSEQVVQCAAPTR